MTEAPARKGWCPGALRPMESGDGLIVRVRVPMGDLSIADACLIAKLAETCGNGAIDLTRRANLQLRGVSESTWPELIDALTAAGLVDASEQAESVHNLILSPLAGFDNTCRDGRGIATELWGRLGSDRRLHTLPPKFGFAIDGGGLLPLGETGADATLTADPIQESWRIHLAGSRVFSEPVAEADAVDALCRCALAFAEDAVETSVGRMRDWVKGLGASEAFKCAGLTASAISADSSAAGDPPIGLIDLENGRSIASVGLPFGRIEASQLRRLAGAAVPDKTVFRLTPWRVLLAVCASRCEAEDMLARAAAEGLATDPSDVRMLIDACTGAPACASAEMPVREDALWLMKELGLRSLRRGTLHLSGCAKGCARRVASRVTLIGKEGAYDLVVDGAPGDAPLTTGIPRDRIASVVKEALSEYRS
jgi:precorrin-3B synthase